MSSRFLSCCIGYVSLLLCEFVRRTLFLTRFVQPRGLNSPSGAQPRDAPTGSYGSSPATKGNSYVLSGTSELGIHFQD